MRSLSSKGLVLIATLAALSACSAGNERASATADSSGVPDAPQTSTADSIAMPSVQHAVSINRVSLSDDEVVESERTHRIRIPDADYWYDPVLGAWGVIGSPTLGFLAAGLRLGGPMPADVSGKGTNIFVNGREIHRLDVGALQKITGPIAPGRYFITAAGLAGFEGSPPQWNLAALAAQSAGGGSWQSRTLGASGFSDGTTGAVFLPNGGIVITGG